MHALTRFAILCSALVLTACGAAPKPIPEVVRGIRPAIAAVIAYRENGEILRQGSGFFIDSRGSLITSRHVLIGATRATVRTAAGDLFPVAEVRADDPDGDLIRLAVEVPPDRVTGIRPLRGLPDIGQSIIVVGSPLGLDYTVSDGIVAAIRLAPNMGPMIQITAPISEGSSGSPVVDLYGRLVGVATAQREDGQNLNFAVPTTRVVAMREHRNIPVKVWSDRAIADYVRFAAGYLGADSALREAKLPDAIRLLETVVVSRPDHPEAWLHLADALQLSGARSKAAGAYQRAIRLNPRNLLLYERLASLHSRDGQLERAFATAREATALNPDSTRAWILVGNVLAGSGQHQPAIEFFQQALRLDSTNVDARYGLGVAQHYSGHPFDARRQVNQLEQVGSSRARSLASDLRRLTDGT